MLLAFWRDWNSALFKGGGRAKTLQPTKKGRINSFKGNNSIFLPLTFFPIQALCEQFESLNVAPTYGASAVIGGSIEMP